MHQLTPRLSATALLLSYEQRRTLPAGRTEIRIKRFDFVSQCTGLFRTGSRTPINMKVLLGAIAIAGCVLPATCRVGLFEASETQKINWTDTDMIKMKNWDNLTKKIDYSYIASDPLSTDLINERAEALYSQVEAKHQLASALKFKAGDAYFGRVFSRAAIEAIVRPFADKSYFEIEVEYKKTLSLGGPTNQGTLAGKYVGNTYKKLRYIAMKYVLPGLVKDSTGKRQMEHMGGKLTIRNLFEKFCVWTRAEFATQMTELGSMKEEPDEKKVEDMKEHLNEAIICDGLEGLRNNDNFQGLLTDLSPRLYEYQKAFNILDPRPWWSKLFTGYKLKIVDCQDVISRWTPFYYCVPYASVYVKVGARGLASTWAHMVLKETGAEVAGIAYAPTYGTGFIAGGDIDKGAYIFGKIVEAQLGLKKVQEEALEAIDKGFEEAEKSESFKKFEDFQKEFDSFDWEKKDFGWDEDFDFGKEEEEEKNKKDDSPGHVEMIRQAMDFMLLVQ
uniref:Uncharacterized protein n=1 Tax=Chromera velia CCMP2878 TaxID=1169474 RepID=A0A0G4HM90_9ALVE|eukprot:Cvel_7458.t1-p1 / transcript=Cvel_7458.t1 / gene=Cvel_7458 / organism=Chromera_velia_CCMP2878 / gene_product=hypothetical protein / transcript_product=hypothetical protein / location=Cvel_scaffold390:54550-56300(+) / protein_length=501 / sequence_SO=supercontig / SO=protein_coding / is_pseudo=false